MAASGSTSNGQRSSEVAVSPPPLLFEPVESQHQPLSPTRRARHCHRLSLTRLSLRLLCCVSAPPRVCSFYCKYGDCPRVRCPDAHVALDELDAAFVNKQLQQQTAANRLARERQREQRELSVHQSHSDARPGWLVADDRYGEQRRAEGELSPRSRVVSLLSRAPRRGLAYFMWKVPVGEDELLCLWRWTLQMNGVERCSRLDDARCVLYWSISCPPPAVRAALRHPRCRILHFPHVQQLTHKDWLTHNISSQRHRANDQRLYPHMPAAFALPEQLQQWVQAHCRMGGAVDERADSRLQEMCARWTRKGKRKGESEFHQHTERATITSTLFHVCHHAQHSLLHRDRIDDDGDGRAHVSSERSTPIWIVKPAHLGSGRGILLTDLVHFSDAALDALIDCVRAGGVAQQYIERPLLLEGHKWQVGSHTIPHKLTCTRASGG